MSPFMTTTFSVGFPSSMSAFLIAPPVPERGILDAVVDRDAFVARPEVLLQPVPLVAAQEDDLVEVYLPPEPVDLPLSYGRSLTRTSGLGLSSVSGLSRSPCPPARIRAFMCGPLSPALVFRRITERGIVLYMNSLRSPRAV